MAIGDAIHQYRNTMNISQSELAEKLHFDRSMISKIETGDRPWPEAHDSKLARLNWKLALQIADERTGGYISYLLDDVPDLDMHPAALKDLLIKELDEAVEALGGLVMARHIDPATRREQAEKVWQEISDVISKGNIMRGVLEEEFGLDREQLIKKHDAEVRKGER